MSTAHKLLAQSSDTARLDAEVLLSHCLRKDRAYLYTWPEREIDESMHQQFTHLVSERAQGVPLAYLTGEREFWSLTFKVTRDTLIPRPETELIVQLTLDLLAVTTGPVLDLGTGSGAIAISLASECPQLTIDGLDNSAAALEVARHNAAHHGVNVNFIESDWFKNITRKDYQIIVSNPPYIDTSDPHLLQGGLPYEPLAALQAPDAGMAAIKEIVANVSSYAAAGGWCLIEHGYQQATLVRESFKAAGLKRIRTEQDIEYRDRVTLGQLPA